MKKKISIVIPCYKSSKMIGTVVKDILDTIKERNDFIYEIILVNDGSPDDGATWNVLSGLAKEHNIVKAVNFARNFGQHSAMMAGYRMAEGDYVLGMDDDGENDPKEMFLLIDKLSEGYDIVIADYESHDSKVRGLGTKINNAMAKHMIGKPDDITLSSYYVVKRFVIDQVIRYDNPYPYIAGLFLQATKNWGKVKLQRKDRLEGTSGYTMKKLLLLWVNGFTAFSVKPLRVATTLGIICAIAGFIAAAILVIRRLFFVDFVSGYASIMVCLIFFSGMVMLLLGIIGEYLGRIYISINNAPQYVIKQVEQADADEDIQ